MIIPNYTKYLQFESRLDFLEEIKFIRAKSINTIYDKGR